MVCVCVCVCYVCVYIYIYITKRGHNHLFTFKHSLQFCGCSFRICWLNITFLAPWLGAMHMCSPCAMKTPSKHCWRTLTSTKIAVIKRGWTGWSSIKQTHHRIADNQLFSDYSLPFRLVLSKSGSKMIPWNVVDELSKSMNIQHNNLWRINASFRYALSMVNMSGSCGKCCFGGGVPIKSVCMYIYIYIYICVWESVYVWYIYIYMGVCVNVRYGVCPKNALSMVLLFTSPNGNYYPYLLTRLY